MATGTTTTTSNRAPWEPIIPYLTGDKGILPTAQKNFQNAQFSPQMQDATQTYLRNLGLAGNTAQGIADVGNKLMTEQTPWLLSKEAVFNGSGPAAQAKFDLGNLGLGSAPKDAYGRMLTGKADTTTLDPVVQAALRRTTDAFNEQVMPGIRGGAQAAGQYGGSRQGIAEGIAAKGLAQSLADSSAGMYNSAYDRAQGMMANAAGQLGNFSTNIANNNAAMQNQSQLANMQTQNAMHQFNAGQMNNLNQFNRQFDMNQLTTGANLGLSGLNAMNSNYTNTMNALNMPNQFNNANLNQYANVVNQAAGQGGSATQSNPYYQNKTAENLGLASGLVGIGTGLSNLFGWNK